MDMVENLLLYQCLLDSFLEQYLYLELIKFFLIWYFLFCDSIFQYTYEFQIYISHHFTAREDMNSTNWPRSQCVASQLSWSSSAPVFKPVTSMIPVCCSTNWAAVEALIFFRLLPSNCLNWKIYCDDHSSLSFSFQFICFQRIKRSICYKGHIKLNDY